MKDNQTPGESTVQWQSTPNWFAVIGYCLVAFAAAGLAFTGYYLALIGIRDVPPLYVVNTLLLAYILWQLRKARRLKIQHDQLISRPILPGFGKAFVLPLQQVKYFYLRRRTKNRGSSLAYMLYLPFPEGGHRLLLHSSFEDDIETTIRELRKWVEVVEDWS